jgi:hypothetical protein
MINIDFESNVYYKKVYLEKNENFMQLNLNELKSLKNTKIMLLLIEDIQIHKTLKLFIHSNRSLYLCFNEIKKKEESEKLADFQYIQEIN